MLPTARTHNNANSYEHSENNLLEFFSKAGSLYEKRGSYYGDETSALDLFKTAWRSAATDDDKVTCMQLFMWLRSIRDGEGYAAGAGNRSGFRSILNWLGTQYPEWIKANIDLIPQIGRWDDLKSLYDTPCQIDAMRLWEQGLNNPETSGLAAKWADRRDYKFRSFLNLSPKKYRKMLVNKTNVVETQMCAGEWHYIDYNKTPSIAAVRYNNAFERHDNIRYHQWQKDLSSPESSAKVNVGAIYPHHLVLSVIEKYGIYGNIYNSDWAGDYNAEVENDPDFNGMVERQFNDLKNFIPDDSRIMPICDFSASMCTSISGKIRAFDVSLGLGLYCSAKVGKGNPFYKKLIPFSNHAKLKSWKDMSFVKAVKKIPDGYVGTTNIKSAFDAILEAATFFNATKDQMPTTLLVISDMQFNQGVSDRTPVEESIQKWIDAGYDKPNIIYWNTAGYAGQPATGADKNVGLVSGFSPSILQSVLNGKDFSPYSIMMETISKYNIKKPVK